VTTRQLNHEPVAMLGLTQSELHVVIYTSIAGAAPVGFFLAVVLGSMFGILIGMIGLLLSGLVGLLIGWLLSKYIQVKKADTPPGFLKQQFQVRWQRNRWLPPTGIFHFRRSKP
jgi:conjugative transfer region protein (TIGR03750 family)